MPKKKTKTDRDTVLVAKVTYDELELVRKASELREQTMSGYVRFLVLNAARHEVENHDRAEA